MDIIEGIGWTVIGMIVLKDVLKLIEISVRNGIEAANK